MPVFLIIAAGAALFLFSQKTGKKSDEVKMPKRLYDLEDVLPENQGGSFKTDYDIYFETVADNLNIPFALLKAHAIKESSLNPKAFRDENPSGRSDRKGWASRGLMQILWWPKSERWKKYGYPDSDLGANGEKMFDPFINIDIAGHLIKENLKACGGNLRDAINMYNTGKKEAQYQAPFGYVDKSNRLLFKND